MDEFADQVVDAINELTGSTPATARRTPRARSWPAPSRRAGAGLTTAAHMSGDPVPVTVRFSNGAATRTRPTTRRRAAGWRSSSTCRTARGPTSSAIDLPCFFVRTPEDFLEFTRVRKPDPETGEPDLAKVGAFLGEHPEALPAIQHVAVEHAAGELRHLRLQLAARVPLDRRGRQRRATCATASSPRPASRGSTPRRRRARGRDYLQEDIAGARRRGVPDAGRDRRGRRPDRRPDRRRGPTSASAWRSAGSSWPARRPSASSDGDVLVFDPDARDRRHRAERRPDPALPLARLPELRRPPRGGGLTVTITRRGLLGDRRCGRRGRSPAARGGTPAQAQAPGRRGWWSAPGSRA